MTVREVKANAFVMHGYAFSSVGDTITEGV